MTPNILRVTIFQTKPNVNQSHHVGLLIFTKQTKWRPKEKTLKKIHIFQDKKYTENVNYTRVRMDTMLTPSKIGTKIRCIITCCVRGNVDEDVDGGCKSDDDDE